MTVSAPDRNRRGGYSNAAYCSRVPDVGRTIRMIRVIVVAVGLWAARSTIDGSLVLS
jgi:hypothetical protein